MDLARKAACLSNRALLTGWLYTSTCFAAAKAVRSERRRQAREKKANAMQEQANTRLRGENEGLRRQLVEHPKAAPAEPEAIDAEELARLRAGQAELVRLRGEVGTLRRQVAALAKGQNDSGELDRNKAAKKAMASGETSRAQALLAKSPEIPMTPAGSWTNAGFATPASALQTLNWAVANGDTNAFVRAMSWDAQARARADELFAALPQAAQEKYGSVDGVILDWMVNHGTPMDSYRVLSQTEQGPDDVTLVEQHQYIDGRVRENDVTFHRDDSGGWRQVLPPEMMPKLGVVINDLAGAATASAAPVPGAPPGGK